MIELSLLFLNNETGDSIYISKPEGRVEIGSILNNGMNEYYKVKRISLNFNVSGVVVYLDYLSTSPIS